MDTYILHLSNRTASGSLALDTAIHYYRLSTIDWLLKRWPSETPLPLGKEAATGGAANTPPLHTACATGGRAEDTLKIIDTLLKYGADVNLEFK